MAAKYRSAIVPWNLEGKTPKNAAERFGVPWDRLRGGSDRFDVPVTDRHVTLRVDFLQ
jgi:hypothetical protein